jgi:zinc D-Ala-D-Ala carboxypeptidase
MLSEHLSEAEFLATSHRLFLGEQAAAWAAHPEVRENARRLALQVFEPVRALLGVPLHVNSGFRCYGLNREVGGKGNSRHLLGLALDVVPVGLPVVDAMFRIREGLRAGALEHLDKGIVECGSWLHLQAAEAGEPARHLALESADGVTFATLA